MSKFVLFKLSALTFQLTLLIIPVTVLVTVSKNFSVTVKVIVNWFKLSSYFTISVTVKVNLNNTGSNA